MKKVLRTAIVIVMVIALTMTYSSISLGAGSINYHDNTPVIIHDPEDEGGIVVKEIDENQVDNEYVERLVEDEDITPAEIAEKLGKDPENVTTTYGLEINLELYDRITDFYNIGDIGGENTSEEGIEKNVTIQADAVIGLDISDFLIIVVNPDTGRLYLISPDEFDPETGVMKITLPSYGVFCIAQKIPIVVRDIHPEEYLNEDVATSVSKLAPEKYQELREWLEAFDIKDDELEIAPNVKIDVDDFDSATIIADVAVRLSKENFSYNLNTKVWGNLYQDINECNWTRVLDFAGVEYDKEKIRKDPTALTEIEPFILHDCFVYHVDADTGEVSIIYEPKINFEISDDMTGIDKQVDNLLADEGDNKVNTNGTTKPTVGIKAEAAEKEYTDDELNIVTFDVYDIDEKNIEDLCMVMSSQDYLGMGPFILFMPKEETNCQWWWLLIILALLIIIYIIYKKRKDDKEENNKATNKE